MTIADSRVALKLKMAFHEQGRNKRKKVRVREDDRMQEEITEDGARYACGIVRTICSEVGPGVPGSRQERERAAVIRRELESLLGARNVAVEEFALAPAAWLGAHPMSALCMLVAAILNLSGALFTGPLACAIAAAALVFAILSPLVFLLQFILNTELRNPSCIPAGTEIRLISFGGEEAGLRGSRRYVERHRDELQRLDARVTW